MMHDESHERYYRRRAAEEASVAGTAAGRREREIHAELARQYARRAELPPEPIVWE